MIHKKFISNIHIIVESMRNNNFNCEDYELPLNEDK